MTGNLTFSTTENNAELLSQWNNFTPFLSGGGMASFENVPLEMLLTGGSDWSNFSQMINMSVNNLTELIIKSQKKNQRDSLPVVATITAFYAIIFIAGVLGNLITCIVISRNKFMHTATNYYLFNLAISDLILLISGMPPDLYNIWFPLSYPFPDAVCILEGILSETSANATVLTITAFTVERYIAICHPFRQHTMSKLSRAVKFILAIWLTAFILAMPQAMQFAVIFEMGGKLCSVKDDFIGHVFAVSGFVFFVGPMTAICVLYVLIGVKLNKSKLLQGVKREVNRGISAQTRVIRMLIAVAVAFFLCWAPFHAQRLMAVYGSAVESTSVLFDKIYTVLTYTSGVLYFLSTCINPLLYNIMSYKFRDAFKITLARQFGFAMKYQGHNHNYSALNRPNGSIRYPTTVHNRHNAFGVNELEKRESDISLQEGLRAAARAHRLRCVSISSQSTLLTSVSKNDVFAGNPPINGKCDSIQMSTIDDPQGEQEYDDQNIGNEQQQLELSLYRPVQQQCNEHSYSHHKHQCHNPNSCPCMQDFQRQRNSLPTTIEDLHETTGALQTFIANKRLSNDPKSKLLTTAITQNSIENVNNSLDNIRGFRNNHSRDNNNGNSNMNKKKGDGTYTTTRIMGSLTEKLRRGTRKVFNLSRGETAGPGPGILAITPGVHSPTIATNENAFASRPSNSNLIKTTRLKPRLSSKKTGKAMSADSIPLPLGTDQCNFLCHSARNETNNCGELGKV